MYSPCIGEDSQVCFNGCCTTPLLSFNQADQSASSITSAAVSRYDFEGAMASSIRPNIKFTNHESIPSVDESFSNFIQIFPQYSHTDQADKIREQEYYNLSASNHVCLDYIGHGLFSYSQQESQNQATSIASTSTNLPPPTSLESPLFDIAYKSVSLHSQLMYGGPETELETMIRKRITAFMNISEEDYTLVFTANQSSAFKLLADSYLFQSHRNLLTVYDYENEPVKLMIESSKKKGANIMSAEFLRPSLRIHSGKLKKKLTSKKRSKNKGLFVFPLQSRVTGNRYSYVWMSVAQENGWHVLLDACALGPKDMETLGLSLFKPDFLVCSFFKVFGDNPSGFCCLFVKKSRASVLKDSSAVAGIGLVRLVPAVKLNQNSEDLESSIEIDSKEKLNKIQNDYIFEGETSKIAEIANASEIEEIEAQNENAEKHDHSGINRKSELKFKGLDHADALGLILISTRSRYLINWLVNALMSLQHPNSEIGHSPVKIYGPKIKFDRGPAVAFNVFDWKGEKMDPVLVQKLADRNNISLSYGVLHHTLIREEEEMTVLNEKRYNSGVSVVTAAIGFLTNFEDVYRVWSFVSRFLDADFVEKERWRYTALNQKTIEV